MKNLPIFVAIAILVGTFTCSSCTTHAGQLTASELEPLVESVIGDLEPYLDAELAPDGTQSTAAQRFRIRGGIVALRNAVHAGLDEELEPLPEYELPAVPNEVGDR